MESNRTIVDLVVGEDVTGVTVHDREEETLPSLNLTDDRMVLGIRVESREAARKVFEAVARWHAEIQASRPQETGELQRGATVEVKLDDQETAFWGEYLGEDLGSECCVLVRITPRQPRTAPRWTRHPLVVGHIGSWPMSCVRVAS